MSLENLTAFENADKAIYKVHCPSCQKLYQVQSSELKTAFPHFDCRVCQTTFTFENPPPNPSAVLTKVVRPIRREIKKESAELKKCMQCQKLNPRAAKECYFCGIVFEKAEIVQPEMKNLGGLPSLMKAWSDLMRDYSNFAKHVAFVDRCEDLQALPFALKKYQELKEMQPQDKLAVDMFHSVLFRNISNRAEKIPILMKAKEAFEKVNWKRVWKISPFVISAVLIMMGAARPGWRNFIGAGVSLLFLTVGFYITLKGRLKISDIWN